MATSLSNNYNATRDQIITRALRIIGAIGQGETPQSVAITEASQALNDIVKEYEADGLQLWCVTTYSLTPIAGTTLYNVGNGYTVNQPAPTKILQAWNRVSSTNVDSPIRLITRQEYNMLGNKFGQGTTSQIFYDPPRAIQSGSPYGVITMYPTPDANMASTTITMFTGIKHIDDFDTATDTLDFPSYWINALVWGLADQLSYEYGVGLSERAMISKKASIHKENALSYSAEEGSLFLYPLPSWNWESYD